MFRIQFDRHAAARRVPECGDKIVFSHNLNGHGQWLRSARLQSCFETIISSAHKTNGLDSLFIFNLI